MLPINAPHVGGEIANKECRRKGRRQGRQFCNNLLHCRMRHMASVYLDQPGCTRVNLLEKLGTGASATVYKGAFDLPLDCGHLKSGGFVAVKMFKDGDSAGCSAVGSNFGSKLFQSMQQMTNPLKDGDAHNFLAELEKLVVAKHPNIVTAMGYIGKRTEGECGLVMELMDESLFDYLKKVNDGRVPPLKEVDMLDLMLEIARGMRFLHECELIHLDLKPKNVLLRFTHGKDHPPEVKIADLGLTTLSARFQEEMMCQHMAPLGTSCYMAPEIRDASSQTVHYGDKVDVFSYGTTCFNILMGNPDACAFSKAIPRFYEALKTGCWKQWVQGCNPFLVKLIGRCWEMDPSMRPTFAELCILLQHVMHWLLKPTGLFCGATENFFFFSIARSWLKKLNDEKKMGLEIYSAILRYHNITSSFADLEVIERCVLLFESHVRENADLLPTDQNLSWILKKVEQIRDDDEDDDDGGNGSVKVATVNKSIWKKVTLFTRCWKMQRKRRSSSLIESRQLMQGLKKYILRDADPLLWIKAEAYLSLLGQYSHDPKLWVGDLSRSIQEQRYALDFGEDEAHVPLQVDPSLLPLLVGFWTWTSRWLWTRKLPQLIFFDGSLDQSSADIF